MFREFERSMNQFANQNPLLFVVVNILLGLFIAVSLVVFVL